MNSWAQGEGQPGLGYIFLALDKAPTVGRGPVANNLGAGAHRSVARASSDSSDGDAVFFVAGEPTRLRQICRPGAHQGRRRISA